MARLKRLLKTRLALRYLSGHPLDGNRRSNATFLRAGTVSLNSSGQECALPLSAWSRLPGWKRSAWRIAPPITAATGGVEYLLHPTATTITAATLSTAGAAYATHRTIRAVRGWTYRRTVVRPMCSALAGPVELSALAIEAGAIITPDRVQIPLPPHHGGRVEPMKDIERVVHQRIGGEWNMALNLRQFPFYVAFTPKPSPPESVTLDMVMPWVEGGSEDKLVLGVGSDSKPVYLDFLGEAPHVAASIGTGGGKSSLLRFIICQWAFHGVAHFDVCDVKQISLQGIDDIPGLTTHRSAQEIAESWSAFRREMHRRYDVLRKNPSKKFPKWVLVIEEGNALASIAARTWRESGNKGPNPMFADLAMILFMARQVNMNVVGVWQRLSAQAVGGGDLRDQFGNKLLSRFGPQAWDALVGTKPRAKSSTIPGRVLSVAGSTQRQCQVPLVSLADGMALALAGVPVTVTEPPHPLLDELPACDVTPREARYSLAEAAREDWCSLTYDSLRQRAHRTGGLPRRADKRYTQDEIASLILSSTKGSQS